MSPFMKRAALLGAAALALGACQLDLGLPEEAVAPGTTVTVTNAAGDTCPLPPPVPAAVGDPDPVDGVPVIAWLIADVQAFDESDPPEPDIDTFTDAEGIFTDEVTAPDLPGLYVVLAVCGEDALVPTGLTPAAVNDDGIYADFLRVAHAPLTIAVSDDEVVPGTTVTATFNACQDDNDLGASTPGGGELGTMAEPTQEEINTDYPDLQVFLDGELVDTIEGTERYPTEPIEVPVRLDDVGDHEISGVCTFQTFDVDEDALIESGAPGSATVQAAAIDYPFSPDGEGIFTYDEDTSEAAAPVAVVAPVVDDTGAVPVPAPIPFVG